MPNSMSLSTHYASGPKHTNLPRAPFFIIGSGRSGSTLLSRMLNCHPRLAVPGESHLFDTFYDYLKYYGDLGNPHNQEQLVDDILSTYQVRTWRPQLEKVDILHLIDSPTFSGIMDATIRSWAEGQGKKRWGEKTPHHIFYWREILECFPEARIIHIVRDGRDVAASYIKARFGPKTTYAAAKRWVRWLYQIESLKEAINPTAFLELRYEDLLLESEAQLKRVCDFLGENYSSKMLEFYKVNLSPNVMDEPNRQNLKQPLLPQNAYKWRESYTKTQLRIFEAIAQPTLLRHGYESAFDMRPQLTRIEHLYYGYVQHPFLKAIAMSHNRPGHIDEWIRLKIRLRLILLDRIRRG